MLQVSKTTAILYDEVDFKTANDFCKWIKKYEDADELTLFINSGGGYNSASHRIIKAIQNFGGIFTTISDELCASAAFDIFLAGDRRYAHGTTDFMIHKVVLIIPDNCIMTIAEMQRYLQKMIKETAETFKYIEKNTDLTPEILLAKTENCVEWHFDENTALKYGVIAEVI